MEMQCSNTRKKHDYPRLPVAFYVEPWWRAELNFYCFVDLVTCAAKRVYARILLDDSFGRSHLPHTPSLAREDMRDEFTECMH